MWGVAFVETRCAGGLGGSGRVGRGCLVHFGHQDAPPLPSRFLWSLFSLFLCNPAPSAVLWVPGGERKGVPPFLLLSPHCPSSELLFSSRSSAPTHFPFCFFLPHSLSLLTWLTPSPDTPCRRLARWAGASRSCK